VRDYGEPSGCVAANTAIDQLVEAGILVERTGYKRNRVFSAPEVLDILNRPFGEGWEPGGRL
jgi:hypothetical protein